MSKSDLLPKEPGKEQPFWFGVRDPVQLFIGRSERLDTLDSLLRNEVESQPICISGLGGVGKTELARKYINIYGQFFNNKVIWINAENYQSLVDSFCRLACDKLVISTKNANGEDKNILSIVEEVYIYFSNGKSLFVFDNAEKYKSQNDFDHGIDRFLPCLPSNLNRPNVLITSRNQKWPKSITVLPLQAFSELEAIEFVQKWLGIKDEEQRNDINVLCENLQFFPLALQQAVAYISLQNDKLKNLGLEFKVVNYLERYGDKTKELLNFKFPEDSGNDYSKTIVATWKITLDVIKQKENGGYAFDILNVISYLAPENIPIDIVSSIVNDEEILGIAIELLKQYSMVSLQDKTLNIHRLVQQVTRLQLKEQQREEEILVKALKLFNDSNINHQNIDHAISVWHYSSQYKELIEEFSHLTTYISTTLINNGRYEEAYSFGLKVSESLSSLKSENPSILVGLLATKHNIASTLLKQGKYSIAMEAFQEVFKIQSGLVGPENPETLTVKNNIALTLFNQGKHNEALKYYKEILSVHRTTLGENHPDTLSTKHSIAAILLMQGQSVKALKILKDICTLQETILGKDHPQTLTTKNSIAGALINQGKSNEALLIFSEICDIRESKLNKDHPDILCSKSNIAGILFTQGKYNEALQLYEELLGIERATLGENHPDVLSTYRHVAETLRAQGKYKKALEIIHEVFEKQKNVLGCDHPDTLCTQYSRAQILDEQGKLSDALTIYQEVLCKRKLILGNKHPYTLKVINCIAVIFTKQGEYNNALQQYEELLRIYKSNAGENLHDFLATKNNMGMVLYNKKEYEQALKIFKEVFNKSEELFPDHPDTLSAKNNIALVLSSQNKNEEALKIFREILISQEKCLGKEHYVTTNTKNNIASILLLQRKHGPALKVFHEVYSVFNQVLGSEHPDTLRVGNNIQSILMSQRDLLSSVQSNNLERMRFIIRGGGDVNTKDSDDRSLLYYAVNNGNVQILNILLDHEADVTQTTKKGNTLLHTAVCKCHREIIEILLKNVSHNNLNKFINAKTVASGTTALHIAAENSYFDVIMTLLKYGAIYNIKNNKNKTPLDLSTDKKVTNIMRLVEEMFLYAKKGNFEIVNKLKALNHNEFEVLTKVCNNEGNSLLQVAKSNKHMNIVSKISEMIQKPDQIQSCFSDKCKLKLFQTVKQAAKTHMVFSDIYMPKLKNISHLCQGERNVVPYITLKEGSYYLGNAFQLVKTYCEYSSGIIDDENIQIINTALRALEFDRKYNSVGYTDEVSNGTIKCFVSKGQGTVYYNMLHSKLNKDIRLFLEIADSKIDTPVKQFLKSCEKTLHTLSFKYLLEAIENNSSSDVEFCIKEGAVVNSEDTDGRTPLHFAVNNGHTGIVYILLNDGADATKATNKGNVALHIAASKGYKIIVEVLLQHVSCDKLNEFINAKTTSGGTTSLHVAAKNGFLDVVKSLLKYGAFYNLENKDGMIPLGVSKDQSVTHLLKLVEELFCYAKTGDVKILNKLRKLEADEFVALTRARNKEGNTLLQTALTNKRQNIARTLSEMLKMPEKNLHVVDVESKIKGLKI